MKIRRKRKVVLANFGTVGSLVTMLVLHEGKGADKIKKVKPLLYFSLWLPFYFKVFLHLVCISFTSTTDMTYEVNILKEMECIHISKILKGRRMLPC